MQSDSSRAIVWTFLSRSRGILDAIDRIVVPLVLVVGFLVACASMPPAAVLPGSFDPLAEDEGFLVVQIDSDVAVESIRMGAGVVARELQPGRYLWLIRTKAGRQRWTALKFQTELEAEKTIRPEANGVLNEAEFGFNVEAGAVNYPGEIVIRMNVPDWGIGSGVTVRNRNHSAMAIRKLLKSHPVLLAAHPIRYAGSSGDEFLQFYTRERDRMAGAGEREAVENR